jgi:hypothetical protein
LIAEIIPTLNLAFLPRVVLPKVPIPSSSPTAYPVPPLVMKQDVIPPELTVTDATAPDPEPESVSKLAE